MDLDAFPQFPPRRTGPQRTILAVDDSRTNLGVIARRLSRLGYLVAVSETGRGALDLISARGFDLVLLDMVMPGMSGVQVLTEIRANPETADLPVVMVTGRSDTGAAVEALAAGADDYVAKPFAFELLAARIDRVLERAGRISDLKRSNAALDARIAQRAMELGEVKSELTETRLDRARLVASLQALNDRVELG